MGKKIETYIKWILFFGILIFLPGVYLLPPLFLGVLPLLGMFIVSFNFLGYPVVFAASLINVVAYGYIFYRLSSLLARIIQGSEQKYFYIAGFVFLLPAIGFIPMYGVSGHGGIDFLNAYRNYLELFSNLKFSIWSLKQG